ncbi:MAG: hypothetical protein GWP91_17770, partial [Rhodobacterales bacterium]|nr:hypothetical protein [Rhodobacterales bacterium]
MNHRLSALVLLALLACAPKQQPDVRDVSDPRVQLELAQEAATQEGHNQTLEEVRLASWAMALGEDRLADRTMVNAVLDMQDFRADGVFRASIGVESAKEWKGEPYEKMMAFLYLGLLRYQEGDYSNALAMTKSAILADTGTDSSQYRADFVPAFVLQSLAFQG